MKHSARRLVAQPAVHTPSAAARYDDSMDENPYQSPAAHIDHEVAAAPAEAPTEYDPDDTEVRPAVSVSETFGARYLAATLDNFFAIISMYALAKSISDHYPVLQVVAFVSAYFLYFMLLEGAFGRTIGKLFLGLVVIQFDGRRCTWWSAFVRNAFRLLEVNPLFFGGILAAISAWVSPYRQRLGDRAAGTIVVRAWRWRRYRKQLAS
jgi:uncharacterized RDD family membrane protein YckC